MKLGKSSLVATRLLGQLRERLRYMHYSLNTDKVYVQWVRFFGINLVVSRGDSGRGAI